MALFSAKLCLKILIIWNDIWQISQLIVYTFRRKWISLNHFALKSSQYLINQNTKEITTRNLSDVNVIWEIIALINYEWGKTI